MLSIAKGFGFNNIIESQLFDYFPGQKDLLTKIFSFVNSYLERTKEGLFFGLGIILLLYTVLNLLTGIENNFNRIWQVKKGRPIYRKITDYISVCLLLPVLIVCSSGLSIFISTTIDTIDRYHLIAPVYQVFLQVTPFIFSIMAFTFLYKFMPNTKVEFKHALYSGMFAGVAFMIFQYFYISGQIWVSKYNAIYGSFAFLPLLLLWLQLSWLLCLIGAEISYASQNVQSFEFEADSKNISRRFYDFVTLCIATLIVKRFEKGEDPYTAEQISFTYKIPIRLTHQIIFDLLELHIINEVKEDDRNDIFYQPSRDINKITVGELFRKIDTKGSEAFKIDMEEEFYDEWNLILRSRENMYLENKDILLKDL